MAKYLTAALLFFIAVASADVSRDKSVVSGILHDQPPFGLSVEQALAWQPDSALADASNISTVPLAKRFVHQASQLNPQANPKVQVLIAPDGMNNVGNYLQQQDRFNLYNFTHWSQIDVLNWFSGTASLNVNIPARPWVEAAHKNGVKVLGTIYLAVAQWGGSADIAELFLQRDAQGRFPMAHKLVEMAEFYGFDGWLMNQETDLSAIKDDNNQLVKGLKDYNRAAKLGREMLAFMTYLNHISPQGVEVHWYDAQLVDGTVWWQNELNQLNAPFFGRQTAPVSDGLFLNYWWDKAMVKGSKAFAEKMRRSPYEVFTGVDLWPARKAQRAFTETQWLDDIFSDPEQQGYTSIALFGNNINFDFSGTDEFPAFSSFKHDATDYQRFYDTETRLFAGDNMNMAKADSQGWKGLSQFVPARTVLTDLPFSAYFNTGHGLITAKDGKIISQAPWHDMRQQDILPSWQFAFVGNAALKASFDFKQAYNGGSSLLVAGSTLAGSTDMPLYKTGFTIQRQNISVVSKGTNKVALLLDFENGQQHQIQLASSQDWDSTQVSLANWRGQKLTRISLRFAENDPQVRFNLGGISID